MYHHVGLAELGIRSSLLHVLAGRGRLPGAHPLLQGHCWAVAVDLVAFPGARHLGHFYGGACMNRGGLCSLERKARQGGDLAGRPTGAAPMSVRGPCGGSRWQDVHCQSLQRQGPTGQLFENSRRPCVAPGPLTGAANASICTAGCGDMSCGDLGGGLFGGAHATGEQYVVASGWLHAVWGGRIGSWLPHCLHQCSCELTEASSSD